jgi:hypothetical protein
LNSRDISKLRAREDKCWNILDQYLKDWDKIPEDQRKGYTPELRLACVKFILERLYPKLTQISDDDGNNVKPLLVIHHPDSKYNPKPKDPQVNAEPGTGLPPEN